MVSGSTFTGVILKRVVFSISSRVIISNDADDLRLSQYLESFGLSSAQAVDVRIYLDESWKCKLTEEHYAALSDGELDQFEMIDCLK